MMLKQACHIVCFLVILQVVVQAANIYTRTDASERSVARSIQRSEASKRVSKLNLLVRLLEEEFEKVARSTFNRPDLLQYVKEHCGLDLEADEETVHDTVTSESLLRAYDNSNIDEWGSALLHKVNAYINGNAESLAISDLQTFFKNDVCSMGLLYHLANGVLQIGAIPAICEGVDTSDASSIRGCLATDIDHLKANLDNMAGATDMDDAVEYFWRIEQTLNRIQQSFSYLMDIGQTTAAAAGMDWTFINEQCESEAGIMGELNDNVPLKMEEMHQHVAAAKIGEWLNDLETGVDSPSVPDQAWLEEKHKQVVCSLASLFELANHIQEGGEAVVCEGEDVDVSDIDKLAQCQLVNLSEIEGLSQQLAAMDETSNLEEVSVVMTNMVLPLGRIQHGLWLMAQDLGVDVY